MQKTKKGRSYSARLALRFEGITRARYFQSQRLAVESFRAVNARLTESGLPPRNAELVPVKDWESVLDACTLQASTDGAVIVRREPRIERISNPAVWWG